MHFERVVVDMNFIILEGVAERADPKDRDEDAVADINKEYDCPFDKDAEDAYWTISSYEWTDEEPRCDGNLRFVVRETIRQRSKKQLI